MHLDTAAAMALPSSALESLFHLGEAPSTETVILSPPENKTSYQRHGNVSQDESSLRATAQTTVTIQTGAFRQQEIKGIQVGYKCTDFTVSRKSHVLHTQGSSVCLLSDTGELLTVSTSTCQTNNGH